MNHCAAVEWGITAVSLLGALLVAWLRTSGWVCWIVANAVSVAYFYWTGQIAFLTLNCAYLAISFMGFRNSVRQRKSVGK